MKRICIIKVGNIIDGLINLLTLGWGKDIASWIALKLGYASCGCEERRIWLNEYFGCKEGIKLN
jgi:hypothetical protein